MQGVKQRRRGRRKGEMLQRFPRGCLLGHNPQESPQIKLKLTAEKGKKKGKKRISHREPEEYREER